jgi:hypothetical protein
MDRVGTQPESVMSKVAGGNASTAYSSDRSVKSSPSGSASHPRSSPRPDGSPRVQPQVSVSIRTSTWSMIATRPVGARGSSRRQASNGTVLIAGRPAAQFGAVPGFSVAIVNSASTHGTSSWASAARTCVAERPARSTSAVTTALPGSGARR